MKEGESRPVLLKKEKWPGDQIRKSMKSMERSYKTSRGVSRG